MLTSAQGHEGQRRHRQIPLLGLRKLPNKERTANFGAEGVCRHQHSADICYRIVPPSAQQYLGERTSAELEWRSMPLVELIELVRSADP